MAIFVVHGAGLDHVAKKYGIDAIGLFAPFRLVKSYDHQRAFELVIELQPGIQEFLEPLRRHIHAGIVTVIIEIGRVEHIAWQRILGGVALISGDICHKGVVYIMCVDGNHIVKALLLYPLKTEKRDMLAGISSPAAAKKRLWIYRVVLGIVSPILHQVGDGAVLVVIRKIFLGIRMDVKRASGNHRQLVGIGGIT